MCEQAGTLRPASLNEETLRVCRSPILSERQSPTGIGVFDGHHLCSIADGSQSYRALANGPFFGAKDRFNTDLPAFFETRDGRVTPHRSRAGPWRSITPKSNNTTGENMDQVDEKNIQSSLATQARTYALRSAMDVHLKRNGEFYAWKSDASML